LEEEVTLVMAGLVTQVGFIRLGPTKPFIEPGKPEFDCHPRLSLLPQGVDARHEAGHDGLGGQRLLQRRHVAPGTIRRRNSEFRFPDLTGPLAVTAH